MEEFPRMGLIEHIAYFLFAWAVLCGLIDWVTRHIMPPIV